MVLRVLDLFSGIGGFSLGLERTGGFETAAFCEIEPFPRKVLAKHWPDVPCFEDVRTLGRKDIDGSIDVICGGFPCQPFSVAGQRRGTEDDRWLWDEIIRVIGFTQPSWIILENVPGLITIEHGLVFDAVLSDLEAQGYATEAFVIPACAVDAKHRRDRVWIVSHAGHTEPQGRKQSEADHQGRNEEGIPQRGEPSSSCSSVANASKGQQSRGKCIQVDGCGRSDRRLSNEAISEEPREISAMGENVADTDGQGLERHGRFKEAGNQLESGEFGQPGGGKGSKPSKIRSIESRLGGMADGLSRWLDEPAGVPRVATGVKDRVNRLKTLGNTVVPQIPEMIGYAILEADRTLNAKEKANE
jgi:DNA (cytosine-5)-methyltransferase 1